jgi:hypothetical protein
MMILHARPSKKVIRRKTSSTRLENRMFDGRSIGDAIWGMIIFVIVVAVVLIGVAFLVGRCSTGVEVEDVEQVYACVSGKATDSEVVKVFRSSTKAENFCIVKNVQQLIGLGHLEPDEMDDVMKDPKVWFEKWLSADIENELDYDGLQDKHLVKALDFDGSD